LCSSLGGGGSWNRWLSGGIRLESVVKGPDSPGIGGRCRLVDAPDQETKFDILATHPLYDLKPALVANSQ